MVKYSLNLTKQAEKDMKLIKKAGLDNKVKELLSIISVNPYKNPPPWEGLKGNLNAYCSRRINKQHRLVYRVYKKERAVKVLSMWSHYENIR